MKKNAHKLFFWRFGFCAVVIGLFIFLSLGDTLANLVWHKYGKPSLALRLARKDGKLLSELGNYYFGGMAENREYNIAKAEQAYRRAVSIDPKVFLGHYQLARINFLKGNFIEALQEINEELRINPENLRSLYIRGLIYGYRKYSGDLGRAEADFSSFIEWAPTEWAGYNDLMWILLKEKKYRETLDVSRKAFELAHEAKDNPWLWNSKGLAELNLKMKKEAIFSFNTAIETAKKLTENNWRKAYPGNDPISASAGLESFRQALKTNLALAENLKL